jgi:hypothetical protein
MRIAIPLLSLGLTACNCLFSAQECKLPERVPPPPSDLEDRRPALPRPGVRLHTVDYRAAYLAELRASLSAIAAAQESVRGRESSYTTDVQRLLGEAPVEIPVSVVVKVETATNSTWAASAVHTGLRSRSCVISVGPERGAPRIHTLRQRLSGHLAPGVVTCDTP